MEKRGDSVRYQPLSCLPGVEVTRTGGRGSITFGVVGRQQREFMRTGLGFPGPVPKTGWSSWTSRNRRWSQT